MRPQRPQVSAHACAVIKKQEAVAMAAKKIERREFRASRDEPRASELSRGTACEFDKERSVASKRARQA
jgi:hypothetical protein